MMPILAKFYPFLYLKTGTNIHDILNISIFQFHSYLASLFQSPCDTSAFKGNGKVKPNKIQKSPQLDHYDAVSFILLVKLRYMQNPVKICIIENIPFFKYFDHKNHFIKDY